MKKISLILLGAIISIAHAIPNYWSSTFAQGFLIYNLTNDKGKSIRITCDSGYSDAGNKHSFSIYDEENDAWSLFYDDKKVEVLIDDRVFDVPQDIGTTSGSNSWENLIRAIQTAKEMTIYVDDKIFGKFVPKNSKKELSLEDCSLIPNTFSKSNEDASLESNPSIIEIPFQQTFAKNDYYEYVGSQILSGQFEYTQSDMDGDIFEIIADQASLNKLPKKVAQERSQFFLNNITIQNASAYLGIDIVWDDPKFMDGNCSVVGPLTIQAIGVNFDEPNEYHWYASITPNNIIKAGPFQLLCKAR